MATLKLIGTYRVPISEVGRRFITEKVTGSAERTQKEFGGLALLEIEVRDARDDFDLASFHQAGLDQVAYDERYFGIDGWSVLGSGRPAVRDFRVCFSLHCFDPARESPHPTAT